MPRKNSLPKTVAYIRSIIASPHYSTGSQLPSVNTIARYLHVSNRTVIQSLKALSLKGIVDVEKNKGTRIALPEKISKAYNENIGPDIANEVPTDVRYTFQRVAERLKEDILSGAFRFEKNGKLPSIKQLINKYAVSYTPLRKAIALLTDSGLVAPDKTIEITSRPQATSPTVLLIAHTVGQIKESISERLYSFLRLTEIEAKEAGINLRILKYSPDIPHCVSDIIKSNQVLGFIVDCHEHEHIIHCTHFLKNYKLPIAIVKEGELQLPATDRNVQIFSFGNIDQAGRQVAQHLLALGHKRIAYISCYPTREFSLKRYSMLKKTFESASPHHTVVQCSSDVFEQHQKSVAAAILQKQNGVLNIIDNAIHQLESLAKSNPYLSSSIDVLGAARNHIISSDDYYNALLPAMQQALGDTEITAWVCADDLMALHAITFLKGQSKRIPADISVVGFEDLYEAIPKELTTYNFNIPLLVARCLRFLRFPKENYGPRGNKQIEIVGHVIERRTTGPSKKHLQ